MKNTWWIGRECKHSNVLSGPVLIGRGLDQKKTFEERLIATHYIVFSVQYKFCLYALKSEQDKENKLTRSNVYKDKRASKEAQADARLAKV